VVSPVLDPQIPLSAAFRDAISKAIAAFLERQSAVVTGIGAELAPMQRLIGDLLSGGKRVRPAFCAWGYVAAAGQPEPDELPALLAAAASLDLLHVSALVHDDVMDGSDLRRGRPAAHRQFEALHADTSWVGDSAAFGRAGAILLGDLLVMWSAQLLHEAGLETATLQRALPIVEAMRTEVTCGQFLDVVAQAHPLASASAAGPSRSSLDSALDEASRVVEFKSARYTVQRPCQFGAALGGGDDRLHAVLGAYGSPLGRAFQFRDDLLGVFGDTEVTGKPAGDDLREGKRTVLVAHAYAHAGVAGQALLRDSLGDPDLDATGVAALQQLLDECGARDAVEAMIRQGHDRALTALQDGEVTEAGRAGLTALADAAVHRVS
jgi:geranylgeranyl diphosphate synthase type I